MKVSGIIFFCCTIFFSCNSGYLLPAEYLNYINNPSNGLSIERNIGDIKYWVKFRPIEFLSLQELGKTLTPVLLSKTQEKYSELQYFTVRCMLNHNGSILKKGVTAREDYFKRMNYLSFEMGNQIMLVEGLDTLSAVLYDNPRTYGLAPYIDFIVAFREKEKEGKYQNDKILIVNDDEFGAGKVQFVIKRNDLNRIPKLLIK